MKCKNIVLLSTIVFTLILNLNSCFDTVLPSNDVNKIIEEETIQINGLPIIEQVESPEPDYGNSALYAPDEKYFIENGFTVDFKNPDYIITKTFSNNNVVVCLNPPEYLRAYVIDGSGYESSGYKGTGDLNLILTDKNGNCLTEIYYNSIKYINPQYLECQLNLQDWYIHQFHPDKYITDIVDFNTGKVIKRYLNGSFSYYSDDLSHLNISSYYYIDYEGNYYSADEPVITDWLSRYEEENTIRKDGSPPVTYVPDDYFKRENIKRGYTDKDFNIIIPPIYDEIYPLDEKWQTFSFLIDGKYFIGDRNNNQLSERYDGIFFTWDEDMPITAFRDRKFCILDRDDYTEIVPPTYDLMDVFRDGYAPVIVGDEAFYIDMTGNRVDISEIPESLFSWNNSALFETDTDKKIKKYLEYMNYYIRDDINFTTTAENIFEDAFYNYVPALLSVSSASEIVPEIIVKREMTYRFALDESYFTPEKRYRMAIYGYYRPVTNDYVFDAYGLHPSYSVHYSVLSVQEKSGGMYEVKVLPIICESYEYSNYPDAYCFGANHSDENEEKYYLDKLLPSDILENIINELDDRAYRYIYEEEIYSDELDDNQIFYKLLETDPALDILKQAYINSPEKYKTLIMTFKIKDALINLITIN